MLFFYFLFKKNTAIAMLTQNYSGFNKPKLNLKTTFFR
jgi:hypothetical protein